MWWFKKNELNYWQLSKEVIKDINPHDIEYNKKVQKAIDFVEGKKKKKDAFGEIIEIISDIKPMNMNEFLKKEKVG